MIQINENNQIVNITVSGENENIIIDLVENVNQVNIEIADIGVQGLKGDTGAKGEQGLSGATGQQGIQGLKGDTGQTGLQGIQGTKGDTGAKGEQGLIGLKGEAGNDGLQGIQGIQGIQGFSGATGAKGDTGNDGVQGLSGQTGLQGIQGLKGDTGLQGIQGIQGFSGSTGQTGLQGIQGLSGSTGAKGDTGAQGIQGIQGLTGLSGATGQTGLQGLKGDVGNNPYITGGTHSAGTSVFTNNTGGTFSVTGYSTGGGSSSPIEVVNISNLYSTALNAGNSNSAITYSNLFGYYAGDGATGSNNSNFFGQNAGSFGSTNCPYSNFFGYQAGASSANLYNSNCFGRSAGSSAGNSYYANFIGDTAGRQASNSSYSVFLGSAAGDSASNSSSSIFIGRNAGGSGQGIANSILIGYRAGYNPNFGTNTIGSNNIIIGTNISLPNAQANSINIGGVLFGTGTYSNTSTDPSITGQTNGRIGVNKVQPSTALHIFSEAANDSGLRLERLTSASPSSTGQAIGVDVNGKVVTITSGGGTGSTSPSGSDTQIQFNNAGAFGANSGLTWSNTNQILGLNGANPEILINQSTTDPSTPSTGKMGIYTKKVGGKLSIKTIDDTGVNNIIQNSFFDTNICMWQNTNTNVGLWTGTVGANAGTFSLGLPTTTNVYTSMKRSRYANIVTTTNQVLGQRNTEAMYFRGGATGIGGFFFGARFGFDTWTNGSRFFGGMHTATTVITANPSLLANTIGFGVDDSDNGLISFISRDATTLTKVSTGLTIVNNKGYDVYMYAAPNASSVSWSIKDLNTGTEVTGTATTNLPVNTTMLTAGVLASNGALTPVTSTNLGINKIYIETKY
ncbi:hypothetical protein FNW52_12455 [Flavobacterium sp. ZT3R18]|uniref:beta strand repeat-containing protein n=1 Tax=Flavobacterium sp. ZT3R18 TaxID=2594429 RepID=UPI00117B8A11|nr:collagen-like protein [Flavobacterium sp. ZT3R18]TRX34946.1 hypothetical protein FNW52_12455 [Flavobacterium sp. ZT3R18]